MTRTATTNPESARIQLELAKAIDAAKDNCRTCDEEVIVAKTEHNRTILLDPYLTKTGKRFQLHLREGGRLEAWFRGVRPNKAAYPCHWDRCARPEDTATVYTKIADLLADHPDLEDLYHETRGSALAPIYDPTRHANARQAWAGALEERGIQTRYVTHSGFLGDHDVADPDAEGFDPIDLGRGEDLDRVHDELMHHVAERAKR